MDSFRPAELESLSDGGGDDEDRQKANDRRTRGREGGTREAIELRGEASSSSRADIKVTDPEAGGYYYSVTRRREEED